MGPGTLDELPDNDTFETNFPLNEEIGCTSSSEDDEDPGCMRPKRPRIEKPWSELLFSKQRVETTPSVLLGISPEYELEFRRYLSDTILTLVQKLNLSLDVFSVAVLLMQRFLMYRPVQTVDKRKLALACVFLASKTSEDRRPPIANFITTFYRLRYRREINPSSDTSLYNSLYNELLFWESQILLVLGFNMYFNVREVRREIDAFCEEQVHIPRPILRCALCVFVLNTLALSTLPVRCSYRVIYLASISLSLSWAGLKEPRDATRGVLWWQFLCHPKTVPEFEGIKEEILEMFEKTRTKFHEYFLNRANNSTASTPRSQSRSKNSHHRGAASSSSNSNRPSTSHQSNPEGLTGTPLINSAHQNGIAAAAAAAAAASASSHGDRQPPERHHGGSQALRDANPHGHAASHHLNQPHPHPHAQHRSRTPAGEAGASLHAHATEHASSSYSHKHHRHHNRHRDRSSGSGEHRAGKERRSGSDKHHRHRSRSRHRHESDDEDGSGAEVGGAPDEAGFSVSWEQSASHFPDKLKSDRTKRPPRPG